MTDLLTPPDIDHGLSDGRCRVSTPTRRTRDTGDDPADIRDWTWPSSVG